MTKERREDIIFLVYWLIFLIGAILLHQFWLSIIIAFLLYCLTSWFLNKHFPLTKDKKAYWKTRLLTGLVWLVVTIITVKITGPYSFALEDLYYVVAFILFYGTIVWNGYREK